MSIETGTPPSPAADSATTMPARAPRRWRWSGSVIAVFVMAAVLAAAGAAELWVGIVAERESDLVRPELTDEGLAQHRHDFETARDTVEGMESEVLPAVAAALGVTEASLRERVAADYPAIDRLLVERAEIVPFAEMSLTNLETLQGRFESADSLPAGWLPGWMGGAWSLVLAGLLAVCGAGLATAQSTRGRQVAAGGVLVVAALLVALPLALGIPRKAGDAQSVLDRLRPGEELLARTESDYAVSEAGMREFDERLMPDVAEALGISRAQLDLAFALQFPEVAEGLEEMPEVLDRYEERMAIRREGNSDLETLKDIPVEELGWFGPALGIVVAAVGAWAWLAVRRRGSVAVVEAPGAEAG